MPSVKRKSPEELTKARGLARKRCHVFLETYFYLSLHAISLISISALQTAMRQWRDLPSPAWIAASFPVCVCVCVCVIYVVCACLREHQLAKACLYFLHRFDRPTGWVCAVGLAHWRRR